MSDEIREWLESIRDEKGDDFEAIHRISYLLFVSKHIRAPFIKELRGSIFSVAEFVDSTFEETLRLRQAEEAWESLQAWLDRIDVDDAHVDTDTLDEQLDRLVEWYRQLQFAKARHVWLLSIDVRVSDASKEMLDRAGEFFKKEAAMFCFRLSGLVENRRCQP